MNLYRRKKRRITALIMKVNPQLWRRLKKNNFSAAQILINEKTPPLTEHLAIDPKDFVDSLLYYRSAFLAH